VANRYLNGIALLVGIFVLLALTGGAAAQSKGDAAKGKAVFEQCVVCHHADSTEKKMGPGLKGLFKRAKLKNGKKVTEESVRAVIESGGNGMPPYKEMLSDEQKDHLIAYLKTL
jgi:cytochrome c